MQDIKVYKIDEVAEMLKVTRRTIYNYVKSNQLKAMKMGREWRITHQAIEEFLKTGTEKNYLDKLD